jgi:hypothetical protein
MLSLNISTPYDIFFYNTHVKTYDFAHPPSHLHHCRHRRHLVKIHSCEAGGAVAVETGFAAVVERLKTTVEAVAVAGQKLRRPEARQQAVC